MISKIIKKLKELKDLFDKWIAVDQPEPEPTIYDTI